MGASRGQDGAGPIGKQASPVFLPAVVEDGHATLIEMQARKLQKAGVCDASCHVNQTTVPSRGWIFFFGVCLMDGWMGGARGERKFVFLAFFRLGSPDLERGSRGGYDI